MNSTFSVLRSMMASINGRLNFNTGMCWKDISVIPMPVAPVAVAPTSSTSRVAWCTTYGTMEVEWDERWMENREGNICEITHSVLTSETTSFCPATIPLRSALSPNISVIPISVNISFILYEVLIDNFGTYISYLLKWVNRQTCINSSDSNWSNRKYVVLIVSNFPYHDVKTATYFLWQPFLYSIGLSKESEGLTEKNSNNANPDEERPALQTLPVPLLYYVKILSWKM